MNRKRILTVASIMVMVLGLCIGCGQKHVITPEDFTIGDEGTTALGIGEDSSFGEFLNAYGDYQIQTIAEDGTWEAFTIPKVSKDSEPQTEDLTYAVAYYFVDGEPLTTEQLIKDTEKTSEELLDYISSEEYLKDHTVDYRYIFFKFSENKVSDVTYDYISFNTELYHD